MTNTSFHVIVIGVGAMGVSSCYFLVKRGYKVLGLEQFDIPHEQGAHAGQSRIIRKAYFEHPDYVPLLCRAYDNWKNLEEETGIQVYYRTGLVYFGKPDNMKTWSKSVGRRPDILFLVSFQALLSQRATYYSHIL